MDGWSGWGFQRFYLLFVAVAFALLGLQVLLFHWRAAFKKWTMYGPVLLAPVVAAAGVVGALTRDGWLGWAVLIVFALGVVDGLVGIYEHGHGIAERIGGFSLSPQARDLAAAWRRRARGVSGAARVEPR